MDSKKKSQFILFLVLATFILPVIIAKLFLSFDFYEGGKTNKGELFQPVVSYQSLAQQNPQPKHWQIIYKIPSQCDENCQYRLYLLKQTHVALGREQGRVVPILAISPNSDLDAIKNTSLRQMEVNQAMGNTLDNYLVIVDPMGQLVMRYAPVTGKEQQISQGKDLLTDLRKMLKLSRIG